MKKNLFTVALLALTALAQAQPLPKNALKMNPVSLLVKTGNISYERVVSGKTSAQLGAFYSGVGLDHFKYGGFGITPEVRFYLGRNAQALNGVYAAPFARYQNFAIRDEELKSKARFSTVGGGAVVGYQKAFPSGFTLDFFAGPSLSKASFRDDADEDDFEINGSFKGFGLRTGLTVGFSF